MREIKLTEGGVTKTINHLSWGELGLFLTNLPIRSLGVYSDSDIFEVEVDDILNKNQLMPIITHPHFISISSEEKYENNYLIIKFHKFMEKPIENS